MKVLIHFIISIFVESLMNHSALNENSKRTLENAIGTYLLTIHRYNEFTKIISMPYQYNYYWYSECLVVSSCTFINKYILYKSVVPIAH